MSVSQKAGSKRSLSRRAASQVRQAVSAARSITRSNTRFIEPLENRTMMSATLALTNPDLLPGSNRLIFNYVQNADTSVPNVVHDQQTLQISDSGTTPLTISSMSISGPWAFVGAPSGGYNNVTVNPGTPLTVTLQFTQRTLPAHSYNQTNYTSNPDGGAAINGALTINSNDSASPSTQVSLAGYWQNLSNSNEEPSLQTIVNLLGGYKTVINSIPIPDLTEASGVQAYGSEVTATSWEAADPAQQVSLQQIGAFRTEGNNASVYWYTAAAQQSTKLFTDAANQGQTLLPTLSGGALATASFTPTGAFGLRVDNEYSTDSINVAAGNTGGGGHHFRFFPLVDGTGNTIANSYVVTMDYGTLQTENFDFQDNVFIVNNIRPSSAPETPANFHATFGASPTLSWNADSYSPVAYNVYSSSTQNGTYALLTSAPITATTYTDTTNTGNPVYYQLVAVDTTQNPVAASFPATTSSNTGPIGVFYSFSIYQGAVQTINPLVNDTDPTGTIVPSTVAITAPAHGTAVVNSNGTITYTAPASYTGTDTFTYTVADSNNATSTPATITFAVSGPIVTTPVANNEVVTTLVNVPLTIPVLSVDNAVTTFNPASVTVVTAPGNGAVVVDPTTGNVTYTPGVNFIGGDRFTYKVSDSNGQVSNTATVDINVGAEISSLVKTAAHVLTYKDENGSIATITLNKGVADVYFDGTGTLVGTVKGKTTVAGMTLRPREIALSSTTTASVLSIKGNNQLNLGGITDSSPLGAISAPLVNLRATGSTSYSALGTTIGSLAAPIATPIPSAGTIQLAGVRSISLRTAVSSKFILGGSGVTSTSLVLAGSATDTTISSTVALGTVKASRWIKSATDIQLITAPSIANLVIGGEFDPDLTLNSTGRVSALGNAHIGGAASIGSWNITGNARSVYVGSASSSWGGLNVSGNLGTFVVHGGGLSTATVAGSINSMSVAGTLSGNVTTTGNILSLRAGQLVGSTVDVGNNVTSIATATAANIGSATLRSLVVTGRTANTFSDSSVIAGTILSFSTGPVNAASGTTPEGLAVHTIKAAAVNIDGGIIHLNAKTLLSEAALQSFLSTSGKTLGSFAIDIL